MKIQRIISLMAFSVLLSGAIFAEITTAEIKAMEQTALQELLANTGQMAEVLGKADLTKALLEKISMEKTIPEATWTALKNLPPATKTALRATLKNVKKPTITKDAWWKGRRRTMFGKLGATTEELRELAVSAPSAAAAAASITAPLNLLKDAITNKQTTLAIAIRTEKDRIAGVIQAVKANSAEEIRVAKEASEATIRETVQELNTLKDGLGDWDANDALAELKGVIDEAEGDGPPQPAAITDEIIEALTADQITDVIIGRIHADAENKANLIAKLVERVGALALEPEQKADVLLLINVAPYTDDDAYEALRVALTPAPAEEGEAEAGE
jgi:hypothetical protein